MGRPKKQGHPVASLAIFTQEDVKRMIQEALAEQKATGNKIAEWDLDEPTGSLPSHLIADKANLPPPEERGQAPAQAPAKAWINGDPRLLAGILSPAVPITDPRTGNPFNQILPPSGGVVSPPPSRNFR